MNFSGKLNDKDENDIEGKQRGNLGVKYIIDQTGISGCTHVIVNTL